MLGKTKDWTKWLVVIGCFCINFTILGISRSHGVLYSAFITRFNSSRKQASWPYGVYSILGPVAGPIAGLLTTYFTIRKIVFASALVSSLGIILCYFADSLNHITFFYGVFFGIGTGMLTTLTHVILNQHFKDKRATATGFGFAGSTIGSFVLPPVIEYLLEVYSLRGTFLLLGGVALHSLLGALLYLPAKEMNSNDDCEYSEEHRELKPMDTNKDNIVSECNSVDLQKHSPSINSEDTLLRKVISTLRRLRVFIDVLSDPMFIIISTSYALSLTVSFAIILVVVDFSKDKGIEETKAVFLISTHSVGDLVGRLCTGWIADLKCIRRKYVVITTMLCLGVLTCLLPLARAYWVLLTISVILGIACGCNIINYSPILVEYVGTQKLPVAMGLGLFYYGLLSSVRPDLIGFFRDKTGIYDSLLYLLGGVLVLAAGLWFLEPIVTRSRQRNKIEETNTAKEALV